jgi:hypothetical protein
METPGGQVRWLLALARGGVRRRRQLLQRVDEGGASALFIAAYAGGQECVRQLLGHMRSTLGTKVAAAPPPSSPPPPKIDYQVGRVS